jgi:hypothetical protein
MTNENKTIYPFVQRARRKDNKEWIEGWFHIELCDGCLINNRIYGEVPVDELTLEYKIGGYWESASKIHALFENPVNTRPKEEKGVAEALEMVDRLEKMHYTIYENQSSNQVGNNYLFSCLADEIRSTLKGK